MIEFFRDVVSGPVYIVAVILSIIFIMAIIGFLMERKKLEKEYNEQVAVVSNNQTIQSVQPVQPVTIEKEIVTDDVLVNQEVASNSNIQENPSLIVDRPTIIFSDPEQTQE